MCFLVGRGDSVEEVLVLVVVVVVVMMVAEEEERRLEGWMRSPMLVKGERKRELNQAVRWWKRGSSTHMPIVSSLAARGAGGSAWVSSKDSDSETANKSLCSASKVEIMGGRRGKEGGIEVPKEDRGKGAGGRLSRTGSKS